DPRSDSVRGVQEEADVLEVREQGDVDAERSGEQRPAPALVVAPRDRVACGVVDGGRGSEQGDEVPAPPRVEDVRGDGEEAEAHGRSAQAPPAEQYERQEAEEEDVAVKEHCG